MANMEQIVQTVKDVDLEKLREIGTLISKAYMVRDGGPVEYLVVTKLENPTRAAAYSGNLADAQPTGPGSYTDITKQWWTT